MDEFKSKIERVTTDLQSIQQALITMAQPDADTQERDAMIESMLQENLLNDFKAAVDHMRHLLWTYVEAQTRRNGGDLRATMQELRIQRVTEMLRVIAPSMDEVSLNRRVDTQSFFEVIHQIAQTAIDRNMKKE